MSSFYYPRMVLKRKNTLCIWVNFLLNSNLKNFNFSYLFWPYFSMIKFYDCFQRRNLRSWKSFRRIRSQDFSFSSFSQTFLTHVKITSNLLFIFLAYFTNLTKISEFISKNNLKISMFMGWSYHSKEVSGEFHYLLEKFIKKLKNC